MIHELDVDATTLFWMERNRDALRIKKEDDMPYVESGRRNEIGRGHAPENAGELAYALTRQIKLYLDRHELRFQTISDIRGALAATQDEFVLHVQWPYEAIKNQENGGIY